MFGTWQSIENPQHILHITHEKEFCYITDGAIKQKVHIENSMIKQYLPDEQNKEANMLYRRVNTTPFSEDFVLYGKHLKRQEKPEHFRRIY